MTMNKVILSIVLLFFINVSNAQHRNIAKPDIIFRYDEGMEIDFAAKTIKIAYSDFKKPYPIHFNDKEESDIAHSFDKNQIDKVKGDIVCNNDTITVFPSIDYEIKLLKKGKISATILVNYYYDPKYVRKHDTRYRAGNFVIDVTKILKHNPDFMAAVDSLRNYEKRNFIIKK